MPDDIPASSALDGHVIARAIELAATRCEAERCRYQRGAQGVWARRWLELFALYEREKRDLVAGLIEEIGAQDRGA